MLASIGIVRSTSASGIYFVGDVPAKTGVPTLQSSKSSDILSVLFSFVNTTISSPQVVPSRSPFKSSERHSALVVFSLCLLQLCEKYGSDTYATVDPPDQAQSNNEPIAVQRVDRHDSQRRSTLLAFRAH